MFDDEEAKQAQVLNDGEDVELVLNDNETIDATQRGSDGMVVLQMVAPWTMGGNKEHEYDVVIEMTKDQAITVIAELSSAIR